MRQLTVMLALSALFSMTSVFAEDAPSAPMQPDTSSAMSAQGPGPQGGPGGQNDQGGPGGRPCGIIAKACIAGGYTRGDGPNDKFFRQCMKPILMGQSVQGVTVDPDVVKACRANKIEEMKNEMNDLQGAS